MSKYMGAVKAVTTKRDGIKGSDDQWYNTPFGTTLPGTVARGCNIEFDYEVQVGARGLRNIIDLPTVTVTAGTGGGYGGGYSGGGTSWKTKAGGAGAGGGAGRVSDADRNKSIVRQSSLNRAMEYSVAQIALGTEVEPLTILKLGEYFASWVNGELEVSGGAATVQAGAPKGVEGVNVNDIPPFSGGAVV